MVDSEVARPAGALLATAAAELLEDGQLLAVTMGRAQHTDMAAAAERLAAVAEDVAVLSRAIDILYRRSLAGDEEV